MANIKDRIIKEFGSIVAFCGITGVPYDTAAKWTGKSPNAKNKTQVRKPSDWSISCAVDAGKLRTAPFGWQCKKCGHVELDDPKMAGMKLAKCPKCGGKYFSVKIVKLQPINQGDR